MSEELKTYTLSCANGYCRNANSRNLNDAIDEAKELYNCIFSETSLYEILSRSEWKLIGKYNSTNSKEN